MAMEDWSALKVVQLKEELKKRGLSVSGKKADMVARLEEYSEEHKDGASGKDAQDEGAVALEEGMEAEEGGCVDAEEKSGVEKKGEEKDVEEAGVEKPVAENKRGNSGGLFKAAMSTLQGTTETSTKRQREETPAEKDSKKVRTVSEVPESEEEQSRALLVTGFERPFTLNAARGLMEEFGTVGHMWMPLIKDKAFVVFGSKADAEKARKGLWSLKWPVSSTKTLHPKYISVYEAEKAIGQGGGNPELKIPRTDEDPADPPEDAAEVAQKSNDDLRAVLSERRAAVSSIIRTVGNDVVDSNAFGAFTQTQAEPRIFWAPVKPYTASTV